MITYGKLSNIGFKRFQNIHYPMSGGQVDKSIDYLDQVTNSIHTHSAGMNKE